MAEVKCGGVWMAELGIVSDLTYSTRWGDGASGCYEASWALDLGINSAPAALRPGVLAEVFEHGKRIWVGTLAEPERGDPWALHAEGLARRAGDFLALDGTNKPTSATTTAIAAATTRGLPWTTQSGFSATPLKSTGETVGLNKLDTLLSAWCDSVGKHWGVFADGTAVALADTTSPKWAVVSSEAVLGVADDKFATVVVGRFVSAVSGTTPTAWGVSRKENTTAVARWGVTEYPLDLTEYGVMSQAAADAICQTFVDKLSNRLGWTNGITVTRDVLTTIGGAPVSPSQVLAGDMVRIFGAMDAQSSQRTSLTTDVILGEVKYVDGTDSIYLAPMGLVDRDLEAVLKSIPVAVPRGEGFSG